MLRKIIHIDTARCNGCGLCAAACHEGAIQIIDGVARLTRDEFCDGFGDCLPACPTGAITFTEREAAAYDNAAVYQHKLQLSLQQDTASPQPTTPTVTPITSGSSLHTWPVQIKLVPVEAPFFSGASLLIAADCTAYAYAAMHSEFMAGRVTLIGCPKLDATEYSVKLAQILRLNTIRDVTVVRMEVPCCAGIVRSVMTAIANAGREIPVRVAIVTRNGMIREG